MMYRPLQGFTLVETMVAVAVLAIALVGPFAAVNNSLNASYVARDQLIASSLAQEGMEYVRSIRDDNYLNGRTWADGLSSLGCYGTTPSQYCSIDPTRGDIHQASNAMTAYSSRSSVPALYVSATGLYNQQSSGTVTRFTRTVQLQAVGDHEINATLVVSWISSHQSYSVTITDTLDDWL